MIRIGILTFHSSINYGAFLQAYALQKYLQEQLKEFGTQKVLVEIVAYETEQALESYKNRIDMQKGKAHIKLWVQKKCFVHAKRKMCLSAKSLISDNIDLFCQTYYNQYDIMIFGSDEIWRTDGFRSFPNVYWGNYTLGKTKYMSYACSSRSELSNMHEEEKKYIEQALARFSYIGVRDYRTRSEVQKLCKQTVNVNCDPTFLYEFPINRHISKRQNKKPVLGIMLSDKLVEDGLIASLQKKYQITVFYFPNESVSVDDKSYLGPFKWLKEIQKCDLLITSFFHGTVFAIKYAIPFIAVSLENKQGGKIEDLVTELDMHERLVMCTEFRNNEFRADRILRRILEIEKREINNQYEAMAKAFMEKQTDKSKSFLLELKKLMKEIDENGQKC